MATKPEKLKIEKLAIDELKQINSLYNKNYDQLRTRIITLFAAGFALLGYLYSKPGHWFLPDSVYGIILYALGWAFMLTAFITLFLGMHTTVWYYPMDIKDFKKLKFNDEYEFLSDLRGEYVETITNNSKPYERKQLLFRVGLYTLIMGGIILMVVNQLVSKGVM